MSKNKEVEKQEQSILTLIQQVKDSQIDAKTFDKDLRQQIVEVLLAEAYTVPSMAQILKVSDKTIKRDIDEIRLQNALTPNPDFVKKIIGEMVSFARINRDHLMRLARSPNTSVAERTQAEYYAAQVSFALVTKLQSLGYLPSQPQALVGNIHHSFENQDLDVLSVELNQEFNEVMGVVDANKDAPESLKQEIKEINSLVEKEKQLGKEPPKEEKENV